MKHLTKQEIFQISAEKTLRDVGILKDLEENAMLIGEMNNIASNIAEYDFVIEAMRNIESLTSAKIEGTTGNLQDLYLQESLGSERKKQLKLFSAINYQTTLKNIEQFIKGKTRITHHVLRQIHKVLTENDPSTSGVPGRYRLDDVRVMNSKLGDFWPSSGIKVRDHMEEFIDQLEKNKRFPDLIRIAITHYQFEAIHPFSDGNGRTGRLLITLQLLLDVGLKAPVLNISQYFERNRDEYISALRSVSDSGSFDIWIKFFLEAVKAQAKHGIELMNQMRDLKQKEELLINENIQSPSVHHVHKFALSNLFITISDTEKHLRQKRVKGKAKRQVARNNILRLVKLGILQQSNFQLGKTNVYEHVRLMNILMLK